jgi:hypothetical protein
MLPRGQALVFNRIQLTPALHTDRSTLELSNPLLSSILKPARVQTSPLRINMIELDNLSSHSRYSTTPSNRSASNPAQPPIPNTQNKPQTINPKQRQKQPLTNPLTSTPSPHPQYHHKQPTPRPTYPPPKDPHHSPSHSSHSSPHYLKHLISRR